MSLVLSLLSSGSGSGSVSESMHEIIFDPWKLDVDNWIFQFKGKRISNIEHYFAPRDELRSAGTEYPMTKEFIEFISAWAD